MPLNHIGLPVGDHYAEMRDFYKAILEPLGYSIFMDVANSHCGFATKEGVADFWLGGGSKNGLQKYDGTLANRVAPMHIAFTGTSTEHVDQWYEAAM